jgi:hypothetical protein
VASDLPLVFSTLAAGGMIVVDDFCNSEWPEVTAATYDFVRASGGKIVPAVLTSKKLYLAPPDIAPRYGEFATRFAAGEKENQRRTGRDHGPRCSLSDAHLGSAVGRRSPLTLLAAVLAFQLEIAWGCPNATLHDPFFRP